MAGPLTGVRVLDMTTTVLGPFATQILGDMGADIWKLESPDGDPTRGIGPARHPKMAAFFLSSNRNKRSIVLDLKNPASRGAVRRILGQMDVVLSTVRPKAMARVGLSYEDVRAINPRVIYCSGVGYNQAGPYADRQAYDDLIQATVGLPYWQAHAGEEPRYVNTLLVDRIVGMATASAVGMALFHRERTGRGQAVEIPMFETMAQIVMGDHLFGRTFEPPLGEMGYPRLLSTERKPFKTKDGYLGAVIYTDQHWRAFFALSGRPELMDDPRFATITARTVNVGEAYQLVGEFFATKTTAELLELLNDANIPAAPLNTPQGLLDDPHMLATDFFGLTDHPSEGKIRLPGVPSTWSDSQPEVVRHAPRLGEHTVELLREAGCSQREIDELLLVGAAIDGNGKD